MRKIIAILLAASATHAISAQDDFSGSYSGKTRYAMFEKLNNGDIRFYISGMRIGSRYPCSIGSDKVAILAMNGSTGGFQDAENSISVEFDSKTARVIVGKSNCIIDGVYKKTGGKKTVDWSFSGD